jgi:hypothetical protein
MASKKPQFPIAVPSTGVRKDINRLVQTPEMAEEGKNCLYFDGVIRPRPAMTPLEFGTTEAKAWKLLYEDGDVAGFHLTAYVQLDDGTILGSFCNTSETAQKLSYSTDMGLTWQDTALHPRATVSTTFTKAMYLFGGYLFIFDLHSDLNFYSCHPNPQTHTPNEYLYRADVSTFPSSLSFTTLGPIEADAYAISGYGTNPYYCTRWWPWGDIRYDSDTGHLLAMDQRSSLTGSDPFIWGLKNALTTADWATDSYEIGGTPESQAVSGIGQTQPWFVNEEWIALGEYSAPLAIPFITTTSTLRVHSLVYRTASSKFVYDEVSEELITGQIQASSNVLNQIVNIGPHADVKQYGIAHPGVDLKDTAQSEFLVKLGGGVMGNDRHPKDLWKFVLAHPDDAEPFILSRTLLKTWADDWGDHFRMFNCAGRVVFNWTPDGSNPLDIYLSSSDDDGLTWQDTALGDMNLASNPIYVPVYNESTKQHFFGTSVGLISGGGQETVADWGVDDLWLAPSTGGAGDLGSSTAMFQMDMDDEDAVIIQGTTKHLLRLDRNTGIWDRLSANHAEEVDNGAAGTWYDSGDIPPLGVSDDRAEYVSGTTIDGTYGTHPFVFRSFIAQGNTFLLATNGQCRPLCYHYNMNGGFARRMGEIPPGDPNDINPWDPDSWPAGYLRTGNLAPVARCMAVGANRVILANLPAESGYAVEVGGFNDPDRGWGLEQFTLLGDTPGEIVGMNELSALAVAMYKTDAIYQAIAQTEFLGVASPFRFELSKAGISGPCSPGAILRNFDGKHSYLARDGGVYMYDGVAPIDGGRNIRRMIQGTIDLNSLGATWGMVDTERKLIWFFYPSKNGLVNRGVVISTDQGYPWPVWPVDLPGGWNFSAGGAVFLEDDITIGEVGRLGDYGTETLSSFSTGYQQLLMGTEANVWFSQKWNDDGDYTDSGKPINIELLPGWTTPGGAHRWTADEIYHIFSSPDPEMEIMCTLKAQQFGNQILDSKSVPLSAGRLRRRTRHRISGTQFAPEFKGAITRFFSWGGGVMTAKRSGDR